MKELCQKRFTALHLHLRFKDYPVVKLLRIAEVDVHAAPESIVGSEGDLLDTSLNQSPYAHDARLLGNVDLQLVETMVAEVPGHLSEKLDLRMGGGIFFPDGPVMTTGHHEPLHHGDAADGDLSLGFGEHGFFQGLFHVSVHLGSCQGSDLNTAALSFQPGKREAGVC
ncbi:MAG TPA: hypothetical protein PLB68_05805 [Candidatus Aminicenantes bacterium]|nr:hypothetical protein [Candidatus Aminicenantes bacterium]HPT00909.1 hypothetical protein [Candidatus Aminicenantes bacterium]